MDWSSKSKNLLRSLPTAEEELVKGGVRSRVANLLSQIEAARKVAAGPIDATKNAIQEVAAAVSAPLLQQKERLSKLLAARAAAEEARRAAVVREAYEQQARQH